MSQIRRITATGQYDIATGSIDQQFVAGVKLTFYGFTGSLLIQKRDAVGNIPPASYVPNYFNANYTNANTGLPLSAGVAITTDQSVLVDATSAVISLNVTDAGDGDFLVYWTPIEGAVGGSGSSSGAGAVATLANPTYAEGAAVNLSTDLTGNLRTSATLASGSAVKVTDGTNFLPTGDVAARAIFTKTTDGTNTAAVKAASTAAVATDPALVISFSPNSPLPAGAAVVGKIGGITRIVQPTVTVTASAYAAGNNWGGKQTLTNALGTATSSTGAWGVLTLTHHTSSPPLLDCLLFGANPAATFTDKSAFPTLSAADNLLVVARISVASTDWVTIGGSSFATIKVGGLPISATTSGTLYSAFNVTSGTPTPAATTDFSALFTFFTDQ